MEIKLTFHGLPGDTDAELTVSDPKQIFEIGNLLQQLPKICPFDGGPTRFSYSRDKEGNDYYGICSVNDDRLKFRFGKKKGQSGDLYPGGWSFYEQIGGQRYSWRWIGGEWRLYNTTAKQVDMSKTRSTMFPNMEKIVPVAGAVVVDADADDGDTQPTYTQPVPTPKRPTQEAYHRNGNQPAQLPEVRAVAAKIEAKSTNENPFIDSSVGATTPQQKLANLIDMLFAKEGDDKVIGVAGWLAAIFSDGTTNSVNQLSDEEAQAAHMYMEAKADEAKLRYHIFTLYPAESRDFESWYAGFVCEAKKIEAVPISKMKPELLKAMLSRLIEREADLKLRFEASKPPVEA